MTLTIKILGPDGLEKARVSGSSSVYLVYSAQYEDGDVIMMECSEPGYVVAQLEDSIEPAFGWLMLPYMLRVPFGEKRVSYSPKSFTGDIHLLRVREATREEIGRRRNLAFNPLDSHDNSGFFPHASANVETRGESVFAARNAIDGNLANNNHGNWPYESWGINQQADAELTIDFARPVRLDTVVITLRADFPHDNWWKKATLRFSDGSSYIPAFEKTAQPQSFAIPPRTVTWVKMGEMQKDETDPSPFPALSQIELWGTNAN